MNPDTRPVHVKIVANHFVTVLPPTEEKHDEVVWRRPKAGARHSIMRQVATLDSPLGSLADYVITKADKRDQSL